ncbi:fimbrial protein [Providencia rettgeri]|uniref:fimbrial protein n=1 Tax=Providencia rettgeri TaxID=587 RepID=UPI00029C09A1|nr:fimbrial protein [Providencia rettgeri]EKT60434.1 fimbrial protein domain-containing protein [Providencia rettgeri Dmel1]
MIDTRLFHYVRLSGLGLSLLSGVTMATDIGKVNNWDVDGAHGTLYVKGALTESACRLAMSSANQSVNLGTIATGMMQQIGQTGASVAVELRLEDCLGGESRERNKLGDLLWSSDMPAMKIRFIALVDRENPHLAAVTGATGIGLQISDAQRRPINLGQYSAPQLVSPGQNQLTYYITPVRTTSGLNPGAYYALLRFQVSYD